MSMTTSKPSTALCRHTLTEIHYRDKDLVADLLGRSSFMAVTCRQILGRDLTVDQASLVDAVMVAVMEHGFTPSVIAARSVYMSSPENLQAGVAAGLLAVGSQFVGTMENAAAILARIVETPEGERRAFVRELVTSHRARKEHIAGFGHHLHRPEDPRALKLLQLGEEGKVAGAGVAALRLLSETVDEVYGRHVTINATGATAAIFYDIGIPVEIMRGFAIIARAAGLVAHLAEEQQRPAGRHIWKLVDEDIPFREQPE